MSRKKKKDKNKSKDTASLVGKVNWVRVGLILMLLLVSGVVVLAGRGFFLNSPLFEISSVEFLSERVLVRQTDLEERYLGKNIFVVDLGDVERTVREKDVLAREVIVKRIMPDALAVDIVFREPYAVIDHSGGILVDRDGFVTGKGKFPEELPRIGGIGFFFRTPRIGEKVDSGDLEKILLLIGGLKEALPGGMRADNIQLVRGGNIELEIEGVPVKFGADDHTRKISTLNEIVTDPRVEMDRIRYIDLRFGDPVIAPKR